MDPQHCTSWRQQARGARSPFAWLAGICLLLCVTQAAALSASAPRGVPLIGRPLQLSIPVAWDRGEQPPCVRAEFLQGESPGGPLRWRLDRIGEEAGMLRVWSVLPVQEPAVTVQLALGCGQQYTREFVLLSEPPNEARDAQAEAAAPQLPVALAPLALASSSTLGSSTPPAGPARAAGTATPGSNAATTAKAAPAAGPAPARERRARSGPPAAVAAAATAAPREPAASRHERSVAASPRSAGPRLKLEAIDLAIDEAPVLRMSSALSAPAASADALARAQSQGLWRALSASPEQQAAQAESAKALEAELRAMRQSVQRYGAESRVLGERLEKVSGERDLLVQVLAGVLVLAGAGFIYLLWLRTRESAARQAWWEHENGAVPRPAPAAASAAASARSSTAAAASEAPLLPDAPVAAVASVAAAVSRTQAAAPAEDVIDLPDFFELDQSRVPTAEELLGLKERADFFVAVGQPEKAVQLLESQLHEHTGSSPFVWLDLLDLCRSLERRSDYERLRASFQKVFAAHLPDFDAAAPQSGGLEGHPRALSRIILLWGSPRVLKMIEDSLFEPPKAGSIPFDLEASRDLLLLYGIASDALQQDGLRAQVEAEAASGPFPATMLTPFEHSSPPSTEPVPLAALDLPGLSGVRPDIHLGDLGGGLITEDFDFDVSPAKKIRKSGQFG